MSAPKTEFSVNCTATPEEVRTALVRISTFLKQSGIDADLVSNTEIVLGEALNNVVEHAFEGGVQPDTQSSDISVTIHAADKDVRLRINDQGLALPDGILPGDSLPDMGSDIASLPEGGFGWYLIRELSDKVHYERALGQNRLTISLSLRCPLDQETQCV